MTATSSQLSKRVSGQLICSIYFYFCCCFVLFCLRFCFYFDVMFLSAICLTCRVSIFSVLYSLLTLRLYLLSTSSHIHSCMHFYLICSSSNVSYFIISLLSYHYISSSYSSSIHYITLLHLLTHHTHSFIHIYFYLDMSFFLSFILSSLLIQFSCFIFLYFI
jgi:hypothetical protein